MQKLALSLLGSPRVQLSAAGVLVERKKSLALLAYLAVTGETRRRDELAALLWPELDQTRARGGLRRAIWELTARLPGPWWAVEREAIGLQAGPHLHTDVARFKELRGVARVHRHAPGRPCRECCHTLAEAVELHRGDFLAGFSLRDCAAFDDWQLTQTEALRRALAAALEQLAQSHAALGEFETAVGFALRWLALDPLNEPAHQQLMRLYAWLGRRTDALRQYNACARALETELGVAPAEETVDLFQAIRDDRLAPPATAIDLVEAADVSPRASPVTPAPQPANADTSPPAQLAVLDRIARGQFVGRELEWAQASGAWQRAVAGEGQVLVIGGEPGIGKSRLMRELAQAARGSGAAVLIGECSPRVELPYAPFTQIAREVLQDSDDKFKLPDDMRTGLQSLAPRPAATRARRRVAGLADPNIERLRLFDSLTAAFLALAEAAPLLLVIEDVHWADAGTLALLQHFARHINRARLLVLVTFRDAEVELSEAHGLPELLQSFNRARQAQFIQLGRLSPLQAGRLLAALLATPDVSEAFRKSLYDETEGNPFFIEEAVKVLVEDGKLYFSDGTWRRADMRSVVLPPTVRAAILARVERLSPAAQEALRQAAVFGREFEFELLQAAGQQDPAELRAALDRATRAQLISEVGTERQAGSARYRFAHALIPFTLREALGSLRLQRLHRRAGLAYEQVRPADVEALAFHFGTSRDHSRALAYTRQAAERAQSLFDYDSALQHLHAALSLAPSGQDRQPLLEQLGDVLYQRDSYVEAVPAYQQALEVSSQVPAGADETRVRLLRKLAESVWISEFSMAMRPFEPAADAALAEGLLRMAGKPPHSDTVRLLIARSHSAWRGRVPQDWDSAERDTRQAVVLAEQLDAPLELSAALESLGTVLAARGNFSERVEVALRRVSLTNPAPFTASRERSRALREAGAALVDVGEYSQALGYLEQSEALASRMHAIEDLIFGLMEQARCWFYLDRWDEVALEGKLLALREHTPDERLQRTCVHLALMASVHALRGETGPSIRLRDESVAEMVSADVPEAWGRGHHY